MLAAKTSLAVRCDAMSEDVIDTEIAIESKAKLERRMLSMDEDKVSLSQKFLALVLWTHLSYYKVWTC